jgi:hypothetical protein
MTTVLALGRHPPEGSHGKLGPARVKGEGRTASRVPAVASPIRSTAPLLRRTHPRGQLAELWARAFWPQRRAAPSPVPAGPRPARTYARSPLCRGRTPVQFPCRPERPGQSGCWNLWEDARSDAIDAGDASAVIGAVASTDGSSGVHEAHSTARRSHDAPRPCRGLWAALVSGDASSEE